MTRFNTYNIDKVDFLSIVQKARKEGISSQNIESAWRATGLIPYHPATVLKKLEIKEAHSPVSTPERHQSNTFVPQTPGDIDQVGWIDELILQFCDQTLDTPKLALFSKLIKGAKLAMADRIILNTTNAELYKANVRKKNRDQRRGGKQYDGQGA